VQWNVSPEARAVALLRPTTWTDDQLRAARNDESEAGIRDLDPWISDVAACDCAYLMHAGEKRACRSFWRDGPRVAPRAIPEFQPTQ
jgi:hypothetical protein